MNMRTIVTEALLILILPISATAGMQKAFEIYQDKDRPGSDKIEAITYELMDSHYYFSAGIMAMKRLERPTPLSARFKKTLEEISLKTGIDIFTNQAMAANHQDSTLSFALGLKAFREQRYAQSFDFLNKIESDDKYFPEAKMVLGTILSLSEKPENAKVEYNQCVVAAKKEANKSENNKQARYYSLIAEDCQSNIARDYYRQKRYAESLEEYDKIPKNSYRWPYLLLEKAWASYQQNDFNRSLGLLVTYKSPLLQSYFFPEAEALTALNYYQLCLWQDTETIINRYYSDYRKRAEELKAFIEQNKKQDLAFLSMARETKPIEATSYAQNLMMQVKKQVKYSLDILPITRAENELAQIAKLPKNVFTSYLHDKVAAELTARKQHLNNFIAHSMIDFLNQIHRYSKELFIIQLEVLAKKRTLLYQDQKLISDRSRGDLTQVKRKSTQHFWHFSGAFWADELGEYSFGLKSNCQRLENKNEKK